MVQYILMRYMNGLLCGSHSLSGRARIISQRLTSEKARSRPSRTKDIVRIPVQQTETVPMNAHVADSDNEREIRTRALTRRNFMNFGEGERERERFGAAEDYDATLPRSGSFPRLF